MQAALTPTSKSPKPSTTRAWLVSAGIHKPGWTVHHYFETRVLDVSSDGTDYEFIFKCFKTGASRRWGTCFVERLAPTADPITAPVLEVPALAPIEEKN